MDTIKGWRWKRILVITAAVYLIFWSGGNWSYWRTDDCVRSHTVEDYNSIYDTESSHQVCDYARQRQDMDDYESGH